MMKIVEQPRNSTTRKQNVKKEKWDASESMGGDNFLLDLSLSLSSLFYSFLSTFIVK